MSLSKYSRRQLNHNVEMINMRKLIKRFRRDDQGAALVEYGILVGLIAVVCIGVVTTTGTDVRGVFTAINTALGAIPGA